MENPARFIITYRITAGTEVEAAQFAEKIGTEQSVEMPLVAVPHAGKASLPDLLDLKQIEKNVWDASLSYPKSLFDGDITQLINVLFGNISMLHDIKVVDISHQAFREHFNGPVFGIDGIRKKLNAPKRALSCTALKPIGLSPAELAENAYQFSAGGIDVIKDDHGLANQHSADFRARVTACVQAVRMGEQVSGKKTLYFPNITTSPASVLDRYHEAVELGADGVLISPQLTGLEMLHTLSNRGHIPLMAHPAFSGAFVIHPTHGFAPEIYYGTLWRALGADAVIYPNAGGRFSFTRQTCSNINDHLRKDFLKFRSGFPTPAGGIDLHSLDEELSYYGNNTIYLIGGSLYKQPDGILSATSKFQNVLMRHE